MQIIFWNLSGRGWRRRIGRAGGRESRIRELRRHASLESTDDGNDYRSIVEQHRLGDADDTGGLEAAGNNDDQPVHIFTVAGFPSVLAGRPDADAH
jgi:hypothetical protein